MPIRFPPFAMLALAGALTLPPLVGQPLTRVAATSLRLPVAPPATTFSTIRAFPSLAFNFPVALVSPPGTSRRLFVVEKTGRIWLIPDVTAANPARTLFLDLTSRVATSGDANDERGLLALAFHPNYAANGQFYLWYTLNTTTAAGGGLHNRLARFRILPGDATAADATSEQPLLTQRDEAANHNGGELLFGPDGYLYLSLGDEGAGNDTFGNSQRLDRDFFSGLVRLDVDQRPGSLPPNAHAAVHPGTYAVPPDNPFVGATAFNGIAVDPSAVRTEFWATGLRNPWRFSFDSATGRLWCADVGQNAREEIDVIVRGGNYGWNYREGTIAGPREPPPGASPPNAPAAATFIAPIWDYPRSQGQSVIGGLVYRGSRYPALHGHYLFADFVSGQIWSLLPDGDSPVTADRVQRLATDTGISSFGIDPVTGEILLADLLEGSIKRLVASPATGSTPFPATLSATGAFADVGTLTPAPGVVAYEPNVSFWSDHAGKRRWFALPDTTSVFGFSTDGAWALPPGAVWVKHFDLELTRGEPATSRRIETRFLVKTATGVYGITYRWNEAQTDATLVPEDGTDQTFTILERGAARPQTWRFPSRAECLTCHTPAGGHALSFNTRQLNRDHPWTGGKANIISALAQAGYLGPSSPPAPATLPALAPATDTTQSIAWRARSYLDANCAMCHQPGGTALGWWDARASTPLTLAGIVNGALLDPGGEAANRVLVPGDATHSRLWQRLATTDATRMPPLATRERDSGAESLLLQWIAALAEPPAPRPASRLLNLASRAQAGTGANVLIPGFVIAPGADKTVLIRAVGPGLSGFGIAATEALAQPALTLLSGSRVIATNTRWSTAANAGAIRAAADRIGAFALPEGGADSALLITLPSGSYTAHAAGVNNTPGLALVEVYDADPANSPASSRLINTAVRAHVGTEANIVISGLVLGDGALKTVLIRAIGPGLVAFDVSGVLAEPVVTLFFGSQRVATNTAWNAAPNAADIRAAADRVGAFGLATGSRDSALLVTLSSGAYTIQVAGANGSTGIALVEVYEIP
jgi:uncharacterized repeat protein (TIGR03806 family)